MPIKHSDKIPHVKHQVPSQSTQLNDSTSWGGRIWTTLCSMLSYIAELARAISHLFYSSHSEKKLIGHKPEDLSSKDFKPLSAGVQPPVEQPISEDQEKSMPSIETPLTEVTTQETSKAKESAVVELTQTLTPKIDTVAQSKLASPKQKNRHVKPKNKHKQPEVVLEASEEAPRIKKAILDKPKDSAAPQTQIATPKKTEKLEIELEMIPMIELDSDPFQIKPNNIQNVPDDGNCLFYSIAVALMKLAQQNPALQTKLDYSVKSEDIQGDLREKYQFALGDSEAAKKVKQDLRNEILLPIATRLRTEAGEEIARKLQASSPDDVFILEYSLMQCVELHNKKMRQDITDLNNTLAFVGSQSGFNSTVYKQMQNHNAIDIQEKQNSIINLDENNPRPAIEKYLELSQKDKFHCGTDQMKALSDKYDVTIVDWRPVVLDLKPGEKLKVGETMDGRHEQFVKQYKADTKLGNKDLKPVLIEDNGKKRAWMPNPYGNVEGRQAVHIMHVNNNHYKIVNIG
ncbi:MAG: hypothetical protein H0W88_00775 [Parachlamydiaceae bacterium]|nr:hypothetical protein [Parachlamydiaceae bacterium]